MWRCFEINTNVSGASVFHTNHFTDHSNIKQNRDTEEYETACCIRTCSNSLGTHQLISALYQSLNQSLNDFFKF